MTKTAIDWFLEDFTKLLTIFNPEINPPQDTPSYVATDFRTHNTAAGTSFKIKMDKHHEKFLQ